MWNRTKKKEEQRKWNKVITTFLFALHFFLGTRNREPEKVAFVRLDFCFFIVISKLTFVLVERAKSRVDQSELEMLERRLQVTVNLENQTQSQVYLVGPAVDGVNVQQLLERFSRPD